MLNRTKNNSNNSKSNRLAGDIVNVIVLVCCLTFAWTVVYYTQRDQETTPLIVIDEEWKMDGFCVQNRDVPYWSSFDTCLYVDVIFAGALYMMYWRWKDIPGMEHSSEIVPGVVYGTIGHGIAHGVMAIRLRSEDDGGDGANNNNDDASEDASYSVKMLWQTAVFCALFWYPLLRSSMPRAKPWQIASIAVVAAYGPQLLSATGGAGLKKELGFSYVQTIIISSAIASQLMLPVEEKRRREYFTLSLTAVLPILVAWNEVLFCDKYLRSMGGHTLYDAAIILSTIAFYKIGRAHV